MKWIHTLCFYVSLSHRPLLSVHFFQITEKYGQKVHNASILILSFLSLTRMSHQLHSRNWKYLPDFGSCKGSHLYYCVLFYAIDVIMIGCTCECVSKHLSPCVMRVCWQNSYKFRRKEMWGGEPPAGGSAASHGSQSTSGFKYKVPRGLGLWDVCWHDKE